MSNHKYFRMTVGERQMFTSNINPTNMKYKTNIELKTNILKGISNIKHDLRFSIANSRNIKQFQISKIQMKTQI